MAKHEVKLHQNTGATAEHAAYLGTYVSKATVGISEIAEAVAEKVGQKKIQVETILTCIFDEIAAIQSSEGATRVNLDGLSVCLAIYGGFPASDSAFDKSRNKLELAVRLDPEIRNCLVAVTPTIVTEETSTKVRLDNVADVEFPKPYSVIHGRNPFKITGYNLDFGDGTNGQVFLQSKNGFPFNCNLVEYISKQESIWKLDSAVNPEPGDYKLIVKTNGGDPEGMVQSDMRKVKLLPIPPARGNFKGIEVKCGTESGSIDVKIEADQIEGLDAFAGWDEDGGKVHINIPDSMDPFDADVTLAKNEDGDFVGHHEGFGFSVAMRDGTATIALKQGADPTSVNTQTFTVQQ